MSLSLFAVDDLYHICPIKFIWHLFAISHHTWWGQRSLNLVFVVQVVNLAKFSVCMCNWGYSVKVMVQAVSAPSTSTSNKNCSPEDGSKWLGSVSLLVKRLKIWKELLEPIGIPVPSCHFYPAAMCCLSNFIATSLGFFQTWNSCLWELLLGGIYKYVNCFITFRKSGSLWGFANLQFKSTKHGNLHTQHAGRKRKRGSSAAASTAARLYFPLSTKKLQPPRCTNHRSLCLHLVIAPVMAQCEWYFVIAQSITVRCWRNSRTDTHKTTGGEYGTLDTEMALGRTETPVTHVRRETAGHVWCYVRLGSLESVRLEMIWWPIAVSQTCGEWPNLVLVTSKLHEDKPKPK